MNRRIVTACSLLLAAATQISSAQPVPRPQKNLPFKYANLWRSSPFTIKPEVDPGAQQQQTRTDWVLSGVTKLGDRRLVILQNRKEPKERLNVWSDKPNNKDIEILDIKEGDSYLQTRVKLLVNGQEQWIVYDKSLISVAPSGKSAAAAGKNEAKPQQGKGGNRQQRNNK